MKKNGSSPLKQIRKHCLSCCGGSNKEVRCCPSTECELWDLRFGKCRKAVLRLRGQGFQKHLERKNFDDEKPPMEKQEDFKYERKEKIDV